MLAHRYSKPRDEPRPRAPPCYRFFYEKITNEQCKIQHTRISEHVAGDVKVSDERANKFTTERDKYAPYVRWVTAEGLDIIPAHCVPNLRHVELKPGPDAAGKANMNHEALRTSNDCYVCEIPTGRSPAPQRPLFEETRSIRES
jgi:hypothetical protein